MPKTVVGLFDSTSDAQQAIVELVDSGIPREDIGITTGEQAGYDDAAASYGEDKEEGIVDHVSNFFSSLFGGDESEDARYYSDAVRRGGAVLTVDAETDEVAERAAAILERYGADVDERGAGDQEAQRASLREGGEARLPVMEEELQVGKRPVERGGVRVRSRVIEKPVEERVRLREERVKVERRPVNRPVTEADLQAFREGTFEVRERAEVPVVDKQARVIEEVAVSKDVGERSETVRDTVRKTDVEVEEADSTRPRGGGRGSGRGKATS